MTDSADVLDHEAQVAEQLAAELAEYHDLAMSTYNLISELTEVANRETDRLPAAAKIQMMIFARLQGDLRVCEMAAGSGYALQAMTIASTIHEVAYGLTHLDASDERAREWMTHSNARRQYPEIGHRAVIQAAVRMLELDPSVEAQQADQEYSVYQQLCWAKHANPIIQRHYGIEITPEQLEVQQIPFYSQDTVRYIRYALLHAAHAVVTAIHIFVKAHLSDVDVGHVRDSIKEFWSACTRIGHRDELSHPATIDEARAPAT